MSKEFNCLERCHDLGACCREFSIDVKGVYLTSKFSIEEVQQLLCERELLFKVARFDEEKQLWMLTCPKLDQHGRCTIYENRPDLCRNYKPRCGDGCAVPKETVAEYVYEKILSLGNVIRSLRRVKL